MIIAHKLAHHSFYLFSSTFSISAFCIFTCRLDAKYFFKLAFHTRWTDLAKLINPAADFIAPMKRLVRPFFIILLLIVFAITLGCRIMLPRGSGGPGFSSIELQNNVVVYPPAPVFNSTILKYASTDLSEEKEKQEIGKLLEGKFYVQGRYMSLDSWRKMNPNIKASMSRRLPLVLRTQFSLLQSYWFDFRRVLQDWARIKRYEPRIMSELMGLLKNPIDEHNGFVGSNKKYSSCAILGNSGILLEKDYGELIDSHEIVIRLNNAKVDKFEQHVGSKTNISFVTSNKLHLCAKTPACYCHPYGANVPIVMYICQPLHFLDYIICNSSHQAPLIVTDPRFDVLCARIAKYYSLRRFAETTGKSLDEWSSLHDGSLFHYSSGLQAVLLGAGICEKVSLFGLGKSSSAKHHYHTDRKGELKIHDYEAEYEFYHDLVNNPLAIPFISKEFKFPSAVIYR